MAARAPRRRRLEHHGRRSVGSGQAPPVRPSCEAPRLPPDVFTTLHHLPDPEPSEINEGHYKTFDEIYRTETSEKYLPSKNITSKKSPGIPFNALKQHANNTQIVIKCYYCNKPRLIFSKSKVSPNITLKFKRETSDLFYVCGTSIPELSSKDVYSVLHVKQNLKCTDPVESIYYSLTYESVCVHCGTTRHILTSTNQFPMCTGCVRMKKKPVLRRKTAEKRKYKTIPV